jgi:branched-subunit amino acid transport protein
MSALTVFLTAAAGTFALRASMLVGLAGRTLPATLHARLALVGPAAIAALCAASLAPGPGRPVAWSEVLAAAVAFVVVRRTRSIVHAFLVGMPVLWLTHGLGLP